MPGRQYAVYSCEDMSELFSKDFGNVFTKERLGDIPEAKWEYGHQWSTGISDITIVLLRFQDVSCRSVSVGFAERNLGFRFGLGFHDKRVVNFFTTRVIWHDFHHH